MHILTGTRRDFSPAVLRALAAYRHRVFIQRLGWPLPNCGQLEQDQFDQADTYYVIALNNAGMVCGCARLLPATGPTLLSDVFPHLLKEGPLPGSSAIWELSRFASNEPPVTRRLLCAVMHAALALGARRLVTVSPRGVERLLHRMRIPVRRAGPLTLCEGKLILAAWIDLVPPRGSATSAIASR